MGHQKIEFCLKSTLLKEAEAFSLVHGCWQNIDFSDIVIVNVLYVPDFTKPIWKKEKHKISLVIKNIE